MLLSDFPVLLKADLIFKDFTRKPSKFKYFSRLWELWTSKHSFDCISVYQGKAIDGKQGDINENKPTSLIVLVSLSTKKQQKHCVAKKTWPHQSC